MNRQTLGLYGDGGTQSSESVTYACMLYQESSPIEILAGGLVYFTDCYVRATAPGAESKRHAAKPVLEAAAMDGWLCRVKGRADCGVSQQEYQ